MQSLVFPRLSLATRRTAARRILLQARCISTSPIVLAVKKASTAKRAVKKRSEENAPSSAKAEPAVNNGDPAETPQSALFAALEQESKKKAVKKLAETKLSEKAVKSTKSTVAKKKAGATVTTAKKVPESKKHKEKGEEYDDEDDEEEEKYMSAEELEAMYPEESQHERELLERIQKEVDAAEKKQSKKRKSKKASDFGSVVGDVDENDALRRAVAEAAALDNAEHSLQEKLMRSIVDTLRAEGGRDIVAIDTSKKTSWVNSMILVTGMVSRHNVALANKLRTDLRESGLIRSTRIERNEDDDWIIVNCGNAVVEIMTEEQRAALDLERLWVLKREQTENIDVEDAETAFTYDDDDDVKTAPGEVHESKKKGNSAMSQQYDYQDEDEDDLDFDGPGGTVMEEYKSKTQEKKAKRKGFKK